MASYKVQFWGKNDWLFFSELWVYVLQFWHYNMQFWLYNSQLQVYNIMQFWEKKNCEIKSHNYLFYCFIQWLSTNFHTYAHQGCIYLNKYTIYYYYQCWKQLCCIFVETDTFFQDSLMNRMFKWTECIWNRIFCNNLKIFTVTFGHFNAFFLNKCLIKELNLDPKHLNASVC